MWKIRKLVESFQIKGEMLPLGDFERILVSYSIFQDQLAAEDSRQPVLDVGTVVSIGDGIAHACTAVKHA